MKIGFKHPDVSNTVLPIKLDQLHDFMAEVHQLAKDKGWYDAPIKTDLENLMLMVSELAEAAEEVRKGNLPPIYEVAGKPEGVAVELADVVLRILDYAQSKNLPLIEAILLKHDYNKTRPYRHGKVI